MHLPFLLSLFILLPLTLGTHLPPLQHIFTNPSSSKNAESTSHIPTTYESAILARRILHLESVGTLSTIFPSSSSSQTDHQHPAAAGSPPVGSPIGLMDYFSDCDADTGNPTLLAVSIATSFRNEAAGSNISLSVRWHPTAPEYSRQYSAVSMPRFSLMGYLETIPAAEVDRLGLEGCFMGYHPDAVVWYPGNGIHESRWTRLVVQEVYWVGGFGDRAYIGWIPVEEWRRVRREEWEGVRLPGEKRGGVGGE
ncbi:MAG: hypothetical protein M1816_006525 [Peltula sp. TS41687]|nr:MAG: hypothetical protein M1816_006525 [Peltula sp. TS41687]